VRREGKEEFAKRKIEDQSDRSTGVSGNRSLAPIPEREQLAPIVGPKRIIVEENSKWCPLEAWQAKKCPRLIR